MNIPSNPLSVVSRFPLRTLSGSCAFALLASMGAAACSASSQGTAPAEATPAKARAAYEAAFIEGTPGSVCTLHPEGATDPAQSLPAGIDEDGVARFQVMRPTHPGDTDRLALDCTDPAGIAKTYAVDLRSEAIYASRPFDASRTNLELRPALKGDPLTLSQNELIQGGYGLRPDPKANPDGYARWLAAASVPAHKARTVQRAAPRSSRTPEVSKHKHVINQSGGGGWSGTLLTGKYSQGATSATSVTYAANEASWTVPSPTAGAFGINGTFVSLWNGLGTTAQQLLQAEVWVNTNATSSTYFIHHQCFSNNGTQNPNSAHVGDGQAITFTPHAGDNIFSEEWYCDATGNLDMAGGYACTYMADTTQGLVWACDQANSTACASYQILAADQANGIIGTTAEFVIENDDSQAGFAQGPWPDFTTPFTMSGAAEVVTGRNTPNGWFRAGDDPYVTLLEDGSPISNPDHIVVSIPSFDTVWSVLPNGWNDVGTPGGGISYPTFGSGFAAADPGTTAYAIGHFLNSQGNGFIFSSTVGANGQATSWTAMPGAADDVAVSPDGVPWVIGAGGPIFRWNGSAWPVQPGCATSIGVGANDQAWIIGCDTPNANGDRGIYRWNGSGWTRTSGAATKIAVSPEGTPWVVTAGGGIYRWDGNAFQGLPGCAQAIGVGQNDQAWVVGCGSLVSRDGYGIYKWNTGSRNWDFIGGAGGSRISVTPGGTAWIVDAFASTLRAFVP